jgi:hypothetical protein
MSGLQPPAVPAFIPAAETTGQLNTMAQALQFLLGKVAFRARRTTTGTVTKNGHTLIPWNQIDEDPYSGWTGPTAYTVQAPGWYAVCATASVAGTGASGTVLIPGLSINGASPTGFGSPAWEGPELFIPTGTSDPKSASGYWEGYCLAGSTIEIDVFLSNEPAANLSWQTTAGQQSRIEIVWMGV